MKFEYRMMRFNSDEPGYLALRFGDLGREGWELISVDNGIAYFKRPVQPKSEAEILAQLDMKQVYSD